MKIRNGFVSNSSSSSFIIRGTKITKDEIIENFNIPQEEIEDLDGYDLFHFLSSKFSGKFTIEPDGNYFGSQDYETFIVGQDIGRLADGEAVELPEFTAEENDRLLNEFENLGFTGKVLKTYVQMISNDNY